MTFLEKAARDIRKSMHQSIELEMFGTTKDRTEEEWDTLFVALDQAHKERAAAEAKRREECARMWLEIYAPLTIYDPAIHFVAREEE